jgi:hypothetical protein
MKWLGAAIGVKVGRRETVDPLRLRPQTVSRGNEQILSEKGNCMRIRLATLMGYCKETLIRVEWLLE